MKACVARIVRFSPRFPPDRELARGWHVRRGRFDPDAAAVHLSGAGDPVAPAVPPDAAVAIRRRRARWDLLCQAPGGLRVLARTLRDPDAAAAEMYRHVAEVETGLKALKDDKEHIDSWRGGMKAAG